MPGFEQKVKSTIDCSKTVKKIKKRVIVPVFNERLTFNNKTYFYNEKIYQGYVIVECPKEDFEELFNFISTIFGMLNMSSIKGIRRVCYELEEKDVVNMIQTMCGLKERNNFKYKKGDKVKIISGAFANFEGIVEDTNISKEEQKIKVRLKMFNGDYTTFVVNDLQIKKITEK
jgi:transcriptional antiterminator NusG